MSTLNAEAFPLNWPSGYPRTNSINRDRARFKATFSAAVKQIINELRLLGASYPVISTNQALRRYGLPSAARTHISDPGVAVYFLWKGRQHVFACDCWDRIEDNLRAVALTIEAMRGMERWGVSQAMERAFTGFAALPAPMAVPRVWHEELEVSPSAPLSEIESRYRALMREAHPDMGGSSDRAVRLNSAIAEARRVKGTP